MKRFFIAFTLFSVLFYAGCSDQQGQPPVANSDTQPSTETFQKINIAQGSLEIVTSFYPLYEIAREVGGKNVMVTNLVPAGSEPHDYEPTPQDMVAINQADLLIYNGLGLESWIEKVLPDLQKSGVRTINLADIFKDSLLKNEPQKADEEEYFALDPHLWMDPLHYQKEVQIIGQTLGEIDPKHESEYEQNARNFSQQLEDLNKAYENGLKNCKLNSFVTNHAAFAYLANRYHLTMIPISGLSPEAEPSPKAIAELIDIIQQKDIRYILTESLVSPKIAETLASETGAKTLILNPLEGLTDQEIAQGKNYISVMKDNLKNLQTALECQ